MTPNPGVRETGSSSQPRNLAWFALNAQRTPFAGIWRHYKGPLKKDGEPIELDVYAFMTTE